MNFLQDNETVIDLDAKILVINGEVKVPLTERGETSSLRVLKRVGVPPRSEMFIPCQIPIG